MPGSRALSQGGLHANSEGAVGLEVKGLSAELVKRWNYLNYIRLWGLRENDGVQIERYKDLKLPNSVYDENKQV